MAGQEPRIKAVVHPGIFLMAPTFEETLRQVEQGMMPMMWNLTIPQCAFWAKFETQTQMIMPTLSVIICTHNPRLDYLRRVLAALQNQTLSSGEWELVMVDNASHTPLSGTIDLSWHPQGRVVREENLGLAHARLRGIKETRSDLIIFVDDDNVVASDYLERALGIGADCPFLGRMGRQH